MRASIETAPEFYGRVDGDMAATRGYVFNATGAFERRVALSRLSEDERAAYIAAYNEAFNLECLLQLSSAETEVS